MQRLKTIAIGAIEGAIILALTHWVNLWIALAFGGLAWWWHSRQLGDAVAKATQAIAIFSLIIVAAINTNLIGQILLVIGYCAWRLGQSSFQGSAGFKVAGAGWLQFMTLMAVFGAEAVWHWPTVVALAVIYLASVTIALDFFAGERAQRALATAWGLIVTEASLIFSIWLVAYVLPRSLLLVPQPAVVITALAYCFGSIYLAHKDSKLTKARLAEYAIIGLCLVVIVLAGTRWNGTI